ncbi:hypothetical protein IFT48_05150 [Pseudomonas fluorescens]|uniref:hypothetical protein n=1 Tax=Pseudomonas fluorescens TaxID=294 RepID=UPI001930B5D1|nr:hypothetical protein [Pseudomonas fluorescens]MBD8089363.1 hypothetical protein [Pseudomonas fluorescens]
MTERELSKHYGRLHLHPVESALWDGNTAKAHAAVLQWGMPPNMEMMAIILIERGEGSDRMGFIETLLTLHQDGVVTTSSLQSFMSSLLVAKSFGNRKNLTKLLASAIELTQQTAPVVLDKSLVSRIVHLGLVNGSEALLKAIGVAKASLEPSTSVMFALVDACTAESFEWVKPYSKWKAIQRIQFLNLFMEQCVRRHPSNNRQAEVLALLLAKGIPSGFEFAERDLAAKECVRSTLLNLKISVSSELMRKAPPAFRMAMVKAGLITSADAGVKGKAIDKMMAIDLGL